MTNCAWVDVETTGLNPDRDSLLEVGITITSPAPMWEPIAKKAWIIPFYTETYDDIPDVVYEMHEKSGLWIDCRFAYDDPTIFLHEFADQMILFLKEWDALGSPMHGATVHFDRAFLNRYYPKVEEVFHYRNFDVSTLKQYAIAMTSQDYPWMDREIHRALPDLDDAIANAIHFRNRFR